MIFLAKNKICKKNKEQKHEELACYAMLALPLIGLVVFTLYSIFWAIYISFFSYTGVPSETKFVGLTQYIAVFKDTAFWRSWLVNLKFAVFKTPIEMFLAFITANILIKNTKLSGLYRSMYFLPSIVSVAIVGLIFSNLFDYFGVINAWLIKVGIISEPIDWFASTTTAMFALLFGSFWQAFGMNVLYFLAALSTVPKEVYESAEVDGAGKITVMFRITLPMIAPVLQVMLLLSISGLLNINDYVLVMTNGAPAGKTYTVAAYLTSRIVAGYGELSNIGYAAAMSVIASIIFCVIGIVFDKRSKKLQEI